ANGMDNSRKMRSASIGKVIAVNRGDDDVSQAEPCRCLRNSHRLASIERPRQSGPHIAERARARAGVPHDHEGGVLLLPAFANIGTRSLLADGMQSMRPYERPGFHIAARNRCLDPDPGRL